jgi:hypothetical protein
MPLSLDCGFSSLGFLIDYSLVSRAESSRSLSFTSRTDESYTPWLLENHEYSSSDREILEILNSAFSRATDYRESFQPLLEMYWKNKSILRKMDELFKVDIIEPIETLSAALN